MDSGPLPRSSLHAELLDGPEGAQQLAMRILGASPQADTTADERRLMQRWGGRAVAVLRSAALESDGRLCLPEDLSKELVPALAAVALSLGRREERCSRPPAREYPAQAPYEENFR
jgi:hypothetical protein